MQAALARLVELQEKYYDWLPDQEYARLLRVANYGFKVDIGTPCSFYDEATQQCRHSVKCRKLHMGFTMMDSACRNRNEEMAEEEPWDEEYHYERSEYHQGRGSEAIASSSATWGRR